MEPAFCRTLRKFCESFNALSFSEADPKLGGPVSLNLSNSNEKTLRRRDSLGLYPDKVPNGSFTQDLEAIRQQATGEKITVAEIENMLQGRGFATLSLILCVRASSPLILSNRSKR